jgi:hypothetical protein
MARGERGMRCGKPRPAGPLSPWRAVGSRRAQQNASWQVPARRLPRRRVGALTYPRSNRKQCGYDARLTRADRSYPARGPQDERQWQKGGKEAGVCFDRLDAEIENLSHFLLL